MAAKSDAAVQLVADFFPYLRTLSHGSKWLVFKSKCLSIFSFFYLCQKNVPPPRGHARQEFYMGKESLPVEVALLSLRGISVLTSAPSYTSVIEHPRHRKS